ncbi:Putative F-box protein At3g16210 [Linum perenne]
MAGGGDNNNNGSSTYFSEDIFINILQWLSIASCIARFRCVCRSWRILLSDPDFIRKIIFSQKSDDLKTLQILISGGTDKFLVSPRLYSVYSYESLRPINSTDQLPMEFIGDDNSIVGCCDGIFCLNSTTRKADGNYVQKMVLWNPTTGETKIVPPGPHHPCHSFNVGLCLRSERIGFGYDPETDDYKVVRVMEFDEFFTDDEGVYDYDPAEFYNGPLPLIFKEVTTYRVVDFVARLALRYLPGLLPVYSLRNDSWKTLNDVASHSLDDRPVYDYTAHKLIHLNQQWDITTSRNEKCYWFRREDESPITCAVISFDMSTEVFELVTVPFPTALTHHGKDGELCNTCSTEVDECDFAWVAKSCFMLKKDVIVVTFACVRGREIWVMLKRGVAESWTRLFTCSQLGHDHELEFCSQLSHIHPLEVWKDGAYICGDFYDMMNVYDIANSDQPIYKHIEIEDTICSFEARIFTPTRVSISQQVNSS